MHQDATLGESIIYETPLHPVRLRCRWYRDDNPVLQEFFKKRNEVFRKNGMEYYTDEGGHHDCCPHTLFLTIRHDYTHEVVGGMSMVIHEPGSNTELAAEEFSQMSVQEMLPHLDTKKMRYDEKKGMWLVDELRGTGVYEKMISIAYTTTQQLEIDFSIIVPIPRNYRKTMLLAQQNGAAQVEVRSEPEIITKTDGEGGPIVMVSFQSKEKFELVTEAMRAQGIGVPPTGEWMASWKRLYAMATNQNQQVA